MEPNQYKYMFEVEDQHWWFRGNHEFFLRILQKRQLLPRGVHLLDAGCGTGRWLEILKTNGEISETGIDYQEIALKFAKKRGPLNLQQTDLNTCSFDQAAFDLITSFDVICNTNVNDRLALQNFHRWLKNDGYLMLSLPAYQFMLSKHDEVVHQNKRYKKKQLKEMLKNSGFEIQKISYRMSFLFPFALLKRMLDKLTSSGKTDHNEVKMPGKMINRLFLQIMRAENALSKNISLPFGLSVFVLAKKNNDASPVELKMQHK